MIKIIFIYLGNISYIFKMYLPILTFWIPSLGYNFMHVKLGDEENPLSCGQSQYSGHEVQRILEWSGLRAKGDLCLRPRPCHILACLYPKLWHSNWSWNFNLTLSCRPLETYRGGRKVYSWPLKRVGIGVLTCCTVKNPSITYSWTSESAVALYLWSFCIHNSLLPAVPHPCIQQAADHVVL